MILSYQNYNAFPVLVLTTLSANINFPNLLTAHMQDAEDQHSLRASKCTGLCCFLYMYKRQELSLSLYLLLLILLQFNLYNFNKINWITYRG
jgi:hypothetical protein